MHLINTAGFGDEFDADGIVLDKIGKWTNSLYEQGHQMRGVLYLHNISKGKVGGSGQRDLEVIPPLVGITKLDFLLTLITKL